MHWNGNIARTIALLPILVSGNNVLGQQQVIKTLAELRQFQSSGKLHESCRFEFTAHVTHWNEYWPTFKVRVGLQNARCTLKNRVNTEGLETLEFADLVRLTGIASTDQRILDVHNLQRIRGGDASELISVPAFEQGNAPELWDYVRYSGTVHEIQHSERFTYITLKDRKRIVTIALATTTTEFGPEFIGASVKVFGNLDYLQGTKLLRINAMDSKQIRILQRPDNLIEFSRIEGPVDFVTANAIFVRGYKLLTSMSALYKQGDFLSICAAEINATNKSGKIATSHSSEANTLAEAAFVPASLIAEGAVDRRQVRTEGVIQRAVLTDEILRLQCTDGDAQFIVCVPIQDISADTGLVYGNRIRITGFVQQRTGKSQDIPFIISTNTLDNIAVISEPVRVSEEQIRAGFIVTILGLLGAAIWYIALRHQVRLKTRELGEANARLVATCSAFRDAIVTFDIDGQVTQWNPRFAKLYPAVSHGLHRVQIGKELAPIVSADPIQFESLWQKTFESSTTSLSKEFALADNSRWTVVFTAPIGDASRNRCGRIWTFQDTTEQKQVEEEHLQSRKINAVGRLAGGVAHDFNNLLQVLTSNLTLLTHFRDSERDFQQSMETTNMAVDRAAELTKQLLAFSRKRPIAKTVVDVNTVVSNVFNLIERTFDPNIKISIILDPRTSHIRIDSGQIEQVLVNLCINARDALEKSGGSIQLTTRNRTEPDGSQSVVIGVEDDGCGMSSATAEKIYEPYFTTKPLGKGTGLGLATAHGIIAQHGGLIECESSINCGTRFGVVLPVTNEDTSSEKPGNLVLKRVNRSAGKISRQD